MDVLDIMRHSNIDCVNLQQKRWSLPWIPNTSPREKTMHVFVTWMGRRHSYETLDSYMLLEIPAG